MIKKTIRAALLGVVLIATAQPAAAQVHAHGIVEHFQRQFGYADLGRAIDKAGGVRMQPVDPAKAFASEGHGHID